MKKKVILHLKNGSQETLYPINEQYYQSLIHDLEQGELVRIDKGSGNIKTIRTNSIEWWETKIIEERVKERIFTAGGKHYHEKDGKLKFITEEEFNKIKNRLYK